MPLRDRQVLVADIKALEAKSSTSKTQLLHAIDSALADGTTWHKLQVSLRDARSDTFGCTQTSVHVAPERENALQLSGTLNHVVKQSAALPHHIRVH